LSGLLTSDRHEYKEFRKLRLIHRVMMMMINGHILQLG